MKKLLFCFLFLNGFIHAQIGGTTCQQMQPICTDAGVQFTANSGGSDVTVSEPGNDYGCLGYSPNPSWYFIEVATAGDITMSLSAGTDIDFIIWGPFANLAAAQAQCGTYSNIVTDTGCSYFLGIPTGCDAYGCSYSTSNTETPGIPNAQVGQVYVMLITNYANNVQDITLTQTGGTGATDCTIVNPPTVCSITNFTATIGACVAATGNYTVNGTIQFSNPPSTGNLIVQDCTGATHIAASAPFPASGSVNYSFDLPANGAACNVNAYFSADAACSNGPINYTAPTCVTTSCYISNLEANIGTCQTDNSFVVEGLFSYVDNPGSGSVTVTVTNSSGTQTQTFNSPFTDNQDYNYSVTMNSDGSPLTVTVTFSADATCTTSLTGTSPANCICAAQIGTFTVATDGTQTGNSIGLCFGEVLNITANGDWTPPGEATDPAAAEGYDPNIIWLVYTCPPSVATSPDATLFITDDPCLFTLINSPDLPEVNDLFWTTNFPGVFTDNTVYFVPITAYNVSVDPLLVSYTNTDLPCYQMGPVYAVQYIPEITFTQTQDCPTGTVEATINGGLPSVDGSQFTAVAGSLSPSNASFVNNSAANGGVIAVNGLLNGDNYSFDISDGNGCTITVSGSFVGGSNTTLTYPQPAYCEDETNPTPTASGTAGGVYSSSVGLSINPSTGVVDLLASNSGTYTVTYTPPTSACENPGTCTITINALPTINAGADITVCVGQTATVTPSGAATYSWNPSLTTGVPFLPSLGSTTYTVTGTSASGCTNTDQITITANVAPTVNFSPDVTQGCSPLTVNFTNSSTGSNTCVWNLGDGTILSGCSTISNTFESPGCYDITLTVTSATGCSSAYTAADLICVEADPIAYFNPSVNFVTEFEPTVQFNNSSIGASSYFWDFGDNGASSTEENPTHDYPVIEEGAGWNIMLVATSPAGCTDTTFGTIYFKEELIFYVPNTFTPDNDDYNQTFLPVFTSGYDPYDFSLLIFNRWGEIIFESHDATKGWDGSYGNNGEIELAQDGAYTWKLEFKTSILDDHKVYLGHVNIIR